MSREHASYGARHVGDCVGGCSPTGPRTQPIPEPPPTRAPRGRRGPSPWLAILRRLAPAPAVPGASRLSAEHRLAQMGSEAVHAMEHVGHNAGHAGTEVFHGAERATVQVAHGTARAGAHLVHAAENAAGALRREPFWQAQALLLAAVILYLALPSKLVEGPSWLMPAAELLLIGGLWLDRPRHWRTEAVRERRIVLALLGLVAASNFASLELLVHYLLDGGKAGGHRLLLSSIVIWLTNVAVFALIYWQLDRGGPDRRSRCDEKPPDFLFAQMTDAELVRDWHPTFIDYLYTSYTNATAFSPTDTLPLTSSAKLLMMGQSAISLITLALVAARAVNILS